MAAVLAEGAAADAAVGDFNRDAAVWRDLDSHSEPFKETGRSLNRHCMQPPNQQLLKGLEASVRSVMTSDSWFIDGPLE